MTVAPGIRRTKSGWQVYVDRGGQFLSKHFPPDTPLATLRDWRAQQCARQVLQLETPAGARTLQEDADTYLSTVAGMRTYRDRAYRIGQWVAALGAQRYRGEINSSEIRRVLEQWRAGGLSPGSLNLRRTALLHLYTVLDGRSAKNPVKDVPHYRETAPPLQLPTVAQALRAIAKVRSDRKVSATRARLRVLLWTGWPPAVLMQLRPEDVLWRESAARVHGRRKGTGTRAKWLPLLPQAVKALRELQRAKAWGTFSTQSIRKSLHRGCRRANVRPFRPYDLRHLFLTTVALATHDDRAVAEFALHADIRQTRRYTEQSVNPRLVEARDRVAGFAGLGARSGAVGRARVLSMESAIREKSKKTAGKVGGRCRI